MQLQRTPRLSPLLAPVHLLVPSVIVLPSLHVVWPRLNMSSFGQTPDVDAEELRQQWDRGIYPRNPDGTRAGPSNRAAA